jgi:hypothetical protein
MTLFLSDRRCQKTHDRKFLRFSTVSFFGEPASCSRACDCSDRLGSYTLHLLRLVLACPSTSNEPVTAPVNLLVPLFHLATHLMIQFDVLPDSVLDVLLDTLSTSAVDVLNMPTYLIYGELSGGAPILNSYPNRLSLLCCLSPLSRACCINPFTHKSRPSSLSPWQLEKNNPHVFH